jgi:hypothetical protein
VPQVWQRYIGPMLGKQPVALVLAGSGALFASETDQTKRIIGKAPGFGAHV